MKGPKKLRSYLLNRYVLIAFIPLFIVGVFTMVILRGHIKNDLQSKNLVIASSVASEIDRFMQEPVRLMGLLKEFIEQNGLHKDNSVLQASLKSVAGNYSYFDKLFITDDTGRIRQIYPYDHDRIDNDVSNEAFISSISGNNMIGWSNVFTSIEDGRPLIALSVKLREGMLTGIIDLAKIQDIIKTIDIGGKYSYIALIDENGTYIAHTKRELVQQRETEVNNKAYRAAGKNASVIVLEYDNDEKLIATAPLKSNAWLVVIYNDMDELMIPARNLTRLFLLGIIISVAGVFILAFRSTRTLQTPVQKLVSQTEKIGRGEYDIQCESPGFVELEELTRNFTLMADAVRKREKELIDSEEKYRRLFSDNKAVMILLNPETGRIVDANMAACRFYGYSREKLRTMKISEINTLEATQLKAEIGNARSGQKNVFIFNHRLADGQLRTVEVFSGSFMIDGESLLYSIVHDITDKYEAERQLIIAKEKAEESSRLKDSLLSNMNHEFRTPLTGILGMSEVLLEELDDEGQRYMVANIQMAGKRLQRTLTSILYMSELESGNLMSYLDQVNLSAELNEMVHLYKGQAEEKGLKLHPYIQSGIILNSDVHLIRLIMQNLIDNAIKYTIQGYVRIELVKSDEKAILKVRDTGIGIEEKYRSLVFMPFRQVSEGFGRDFEGNGLGLALTRKMLELMQGSISFISTPGEGTEFTVEIPVDCGNCQNSEALSCKTDIMANSAASEKLLLVEDNIINVQVVKMFLKGKYEVEHARNAEMALQMVKATQYSRILMDINLGSGLNGIEATKLIREIEGYSELPIIAVTGYSAQSEKEKLLNSGFSSYLAKPFEKKELIEVLGPAIRYGRL